MAVERRLVTVPSADVARSTALGEAADPEDVRALLAGLVGIAAEAVERHGGRVEKFDELEAINDVAQATRITRDRNGATIARAS